jgi:hypothetical protein
VRTADRVWRGRRRCGAKVRNDGAGPGAGLKVSLGDELVVGGVDRSAGEPQLRGEGTGRRQFRLWRKPPRADAVAQRAFERNSTPRSRADLEV